MIPRSRSYASGYKKCQPHRERCVKRVKGDYQSVPFQVFNFLVKRFNLRLVVGQLRCNGTLVAAGKENQRQAKQEQA